MLDVAARQSRTQRSPRAAHRVARNPLPVAGLLQASTMTTPPPTISVRLPPSPPPTGPHPRRRDGPAATSPAATPLLSWAAHAVALGVVLGVRLSRGMRAAALPRQPPRPCARALACSGGADSPGGGGGGVAAMLGDSIPIPSALDETIPTGVLSIPRAHLDRLSHVDYGDLLPSLPACRSGTGLCVPLPPPPTHVPHKRTYFSNKESAL